MNLKELPPVPMVQQPCELSLSFQENGEDLEIQLGSGTHIGQIHLGRVISQEISDHILELVRRYQTDIIPRVQEVESIVDENSKNRMRASLFLECFETRWKMFEDLGGLGFRRKLPITRLFNGDHEMWDDDLNRFNIVDVILPFEYQDPENKG